VTPPPPAVIERAVGGVGVRRCGVRHHGTASAGAGYGLGDHLCWPFDDYDDFRREAMAFLADGAQLGQRLLYSADRPLDDLQRDVLDGLPGADRLLASGGLAVESLFDTYEVSAVSDPGAQAAAYVARTGDAVVAGYTGLRAAADVTLLASDTVSRDAFVRYEHLIDRAMLDMPFTAMCGYDRSRLTPRAANEMASVHPHRRSGSSTFALFNDDDGLLLTGDVDAAVDPTFGVSVGRVLETIHGDVIDVDCSELDFLDSCGLQVLDHAAAAARVVVRLERPPPSSERLIELLDPLTVSVASRR